MKKLSFGSPIADAPVYFKERTDSTMEDAKKLIADGAEHGTVVFTDFQTAGRGRRSDRIWESEREANLLFTLILDQDKIALPLQVVPLVGGLALAVVLKTTFALEPRIRWPNDVLVRDKKISGILCTTAAKRLLIGFGVNCNQVAFAPEIADSVTSINLLIKKTIDHRALLVQVIREIKLQLANSRWREAVGQRLWGKGERCLFFQDEACCTEGRRGELIGLLHSGALQYRDAETGETLTLVSGTYRRADFNR